jgi:hypothetical protein
VTISPSVVDDCDVAPTCAIAAVRSSEGAGAGAWTVTGELSVALRAERTGAGPGRTYTIDVACTDESGNTSVASTHIVVPHDKGPDK